MANLNLDVEEQKRANKKAPTVTYKNKTFVLPKELPFELFEALIKISEDPTQAMVALDSLLEALFGEEKQDFLNLKPSVETVMALFTGITDQYEIAPEKS